MLATNLSSRSIKLGLAPLTVAPLLVPAIALLTLSVSKETAILISGISLVSEIPALAVMYTVFIRPRRRFQKLLAEGLHGRARILKSTPSTWVRVNGKPLTKQYLEIHHPTKPPYQTVERFLYSDKPLPTEGEYNCLIDPKNPECVAVLIAWQREIAMEHGFGSYKS